MAYKHQSEAAIRERNHISAETEVHARLLTPPQKKGCMEKQLETKRRRTRESLTFSDGIAVSLTLKRLQCFASLMS